MSRRTDSDRPGPRRLRHLLATASVVLLGAGTVLAASPAQAITGGFPVPAGRYGFVAEVHNNGGTCTGSLIHPSWVLTAAHCAALPPYEWAPPANMDVRIGNIYRGTGGYPRQVSQVVPYPHNNGGHDDVALLKLSAPVTDVTPVRLATPADAPRWDGTSSSTLTPYDDGVAVGWGVNSAGAFPTQLQTRPVSIKPSTLDGLGIKAINVSAGPCPGDSGGPLLVEVNGTMVQAGVTKSADCATSGGYSEVGAGPNRDWILSKVPAMPYTSFGAADWNRDGEKDVLARDDRTGKLWLYYGSSLAPQFSRSRAELGGDWRGFTSFGLTDWDGDRNPDILARRDSSGSLWVYFGQGAQSTAIAGGTNLSFGWENMTPFGATDWDGDSHADIVARQNNTGDLFVYPGQGGRGQLNNNGRVWLGNGWKGFSPFGLTDWDRNNRPDVIARDDKSGELFQYNGQGRALITSRKRIGTGWTGFTSFGATNWHSTTAQHVLARQDNTGELFRYQGEGTENQITTRFRLGTGW